MDFDEISELIKEYLQKGKCKILNLIIYAEHRRILQNPKNHFRQ